MAHSSAPSSSSLPPKNPKSQTWRETAAIITENVSDDPSHPVQIALRTYTLSLSLSLGPTLIPLLLALINRPQSLKARLRVLKRVLKRELGPTGFASAITVAIAGGAGLQRLWEILECREGSPQLEDKLSPPPARDWTQRLKLTQYQKAFLANVVTSTLAIILLQWRGRRRAGRISPTTDLSLLFLVRALDASVQSLLYQKGQQVPNGKASTIPPHLMIYGPSGEPISLPNSISSLNETSEDLAKEWQKKIATRLDALVFWACSARIMWCFFYQPQRLPPSYVKWINSLANADRRLLDVLRALREGKWSYIHGSPTQRNLVCTLSEKLGHPPSWGDPVLLPSHGGPVADAAWKTLGVHGRNGIGGLPCELVHGGVAARLGLKNSCIANAAVRAAYAFVEALAIYLPVHFLPLLLAKPSSVLRLHRALPPLLSALRSAAFLSTFLSSCWFSICFTRTLVLGRLFPSVSHDIWDGPYGCAFAGSLACGASIWIENARRRGEMALYVLPKALRASIPETWLRSGHPAVKIAERIIFVLSLASLLTFGLHQPESLRGLSRWTLAFVMKGPNAGFWKKRKREITTCPPTPVDPSMLPPASPSTPTNNDPDA
ncbi:hypothetical protein HYDPIDRAFT_173171 [Hydnomerulius pinastri MD-312]|nr:hypothetical protein HYDPIDRAFT_173171 [Hydnomerulius pinastri MD-312]